MTTFVFRDGSRLTPYMFYQIERLNADVKRMFGVEVRVTSGIRLAQEQIDIFLSRYVTAANIRGRRVYDTRVWRGTRYYRISSAGTVAVPGTSNHEIQGNSGAVDLRDTGRDGGLATAGSKRSNWLRANCHSYGMVAEGFGFNEAWHYKMLNIFSAVPSGGGGSTTPSKGNKVIHYHVEDATSRKRGRTVVPGNGFWLHTTDGIAISQAINVAGGAGAYIFTLHTYATGTPGDVVDMQLYWDDTRTEGPHSGHYAERMIVDANGVLNHSVTSQRFVAAGYAVYARFSTPSTNKGPIKVSVFDADAYLIN